MKFSAALTNHFINGILQKFPTQGKKELQSTKHGKNKNTKQEEEEQRPKSQSRAVYQQGIICPG
jgi:hypothetical protein